MSENCGNHIDHIKKLDRQEIINAEVERRLYRVESRQDVSDEKFKQVFEKLDEIIEILKISQSRMPNLVWGSLGSVFGGVGVWIMLRLIQS